MRNRLIEIFKENQQQIYDEMAIGASMYGVMADQIIKELEACPVETIVMPSLSIKAERTMPVEMVVREEYEQIKTFYKDVYHLLGSMGYDPDAKNVNELLNRAKAFVDKHEY